MPTTVRSECADAIEVFLEMGGEIEELPGLTASELIPRDSRPPLLLMPAGLPQRRKLWAVRSALMACLIERVERASLVETLRSLFLRPLAIGLPLAICALEHINAAPHVPSFFPGY